MNTLHHFAAACIARRAVLPPEAQAGMTGAGNDRSTPRSLSPLPQHR